MKYDGKIGIILNLIFLYLRSSYLVDVKVGEIVDVFFNRFFLDFFVKGEFLKELVEILKSEGFVFDYQKEDFDVIKYNMVDLLGVNYYQLRCVKVKEYFLNFDVFFLLDRYFDFYVMLGCKMNFYCGWEIYEKGVYDILINLKENYGNIECFIFENGMGVEGEECFRDE